MAVEMALEGARDAHATTNLIDLRNYELAFLNGDRQYTGYPAGVAALREAVKAADGVILGTPEYHGSFSGVLKNAIDLMGFEEFEGKMIGLIGVSGGQMGAFDALNSLLKKTLAALCERANLIEPRHTVSVSADEPDNRFLAETSGANFLVTGNKRHFPETWKSTRVVTARQLLEP